MWATVSIIGMLLMQPTDPQKANPRTVVQLQQFSWTEGGLEEAIKVGALGQWAVMASRLVGGIMPYVAIEHTGGQSCAYPIGK